MSGTKQNKNKNKKEKNDASPSPSEATHNDNNEEQLTAEPSTSNNPPDQSASQVLKLSAFSRTRDFIKSRSKRICQTLENYQAANGIPIAKFGDTIMENGLTCKQESDILPYGWHKEDIYAFAPDGSLFCWDTTTEKVRWYTRVSEPLHVSHRSLEEDFPSYLKMVRGSLKLYKQARNSLSAELSLNADGFFEHPYEYKDGNLTTSKESIVIHVNPETGKEEKFDNFKQNFVDGKIHFSRIYYKLTCRDPNTDKILWYLRYALFKALLKNNYEPPRKGQNILTPGTVHNILWHGEVKDKDGNIVQVGEYNLPYVVIHIEKGQSSKDAVKKEVREISDVCSGNINLLNVYEVVSDEDEDFHKVSTEHCNTSLRQFMHSPDKDDKILELIRGIVTGLVGLHKKGIFLGNLDINDIFVDIHSNAKISVISKKTIFPLISSVNGAKDDMLALGRLIFFILVGAEYDKDNEDLTNPIYHNPEALDLLRKLLNERPASEQTALQVWNHPFLWDPSDKLKFICTVSEHLEAEDGNSELSSAINILRPFVFGQRWGTLLDVKLLEAVQSGAHTQYNHNHEYCLMHYLIRFIRNLKSHESKITVAIMLIMQRGEDVPIEVREMFRTREFGSYIFSRFPNLVMEVYNIMKERRGEDIKFREYFTDGPYRKIIVQG